MIRRFPSAPALAVVAALALAACGSDDATDAAPSATEPSATEVTSADGPGGSPASSAPAQTGGVVTVAVPTSWDAYNSSTTTGGRPQNVLVDTLTQAGFWSFDAAGGVVRNEAFGSFEKVSDDPLTVQYTLSDDAVWSDGEPIDFDDVLLNWATSSYQFTDDTGASIFDTWGDPGAELQEEPQGAPGDKSFTVVYTEPYADWETTIRSFLPAHVVAREAGLTPEELVAAIQERDEAALARIAEFWNTGWQYTAESPVPDPALVPSSGPFVLAERQGSSLVLHRNDLVAGTPANIDTIILRTLDAAEQPQALLNGDVDVIMPLPQRDVYEQLAAADGITTLTGDRFTYDHVDFNFESPVFSSAAARQAFALCIPRQQIVDNLVVPVQPEAQIAQLREYFAFQPAYEEVLADVPAAADYAETDIDRARTLLEEAGLAGSTVTLLTTASNDRHASMATMIAASCAPAGFDVQTEMSGEFSQLLGEGGWDVTLFQWVGSGVALATEGIYRSDGALNFGKYRSEVVDELWTALHSVTEADEVLAIKAQIEQELWTDLYSVPIAAQPGLVAFRDRVQGVEMNASSTGVTFNAAEWTVTS